MAQGWNHSIDSYLQHKLCFAEHVIFDGLFHKELEPVGRTHVGVFQGELFPVGGTPHWSRARA